MGNCMVTPMTLFRYWAHSYYHNLLYLHISLISFFSIHIASITLQGTVFHVKSLPSSIFRQKYLWFCVTYEVWNWEQKMSTQCRNLKHCVDLHTSTQCRNLKHCVDLHTSTQCRNLKHCVDLHTSTQCRNLKHCVDLHTSRPHSVFTN